MVGITCSWIRGFEDLSCKFTSNLISKIDFGVEMVKASKERVCSNYVEMDVHNLEIVNSILTSY